VIEWLDSRLPGLEREKRDAVMLNASTVPATLEKLDVVDGNEPAKALASFSQRRKPR
jgi:hypothetical protein